MAHPQDQRVAFAATPIGRFELFALPPNADFERVDNDSEPVLGLKLRGGEYTVQAPRAQASFELGGVKTGFGPLGSMILRPGGATMHAKANTGPATRLLLVTFDRAKFEALTGLRRWDVQRLEFCRDLASPALFKILRNAVRELESRRLKCEAALEALGHLALIEVARAFADSAGAGRPSGLTQWQLEKIERRLREAEGHWPTSEELAGLCGISACHLSRCFRATTGQTLSSYASDIRMTQARGLLATSDLTLQQISGRLGFNSPSSFSYAFRQATGRTPKEHRQLARGLQAA